MQAILDFFTGTDPVHELLDRLRLVAGGLEWGNELKFWHGTVFKIKCGS